MQPGVKPAPSQTRDDPATPYAINYLPGRWAYQKHAAQLAGQPFVVKYHYEY